MAGLHKPEVCECGSSNMHREYHPERWVCNTCDTIVVSRGQKIETGVCRRCGAKKTDGVLFANHGNICCKCKAEYNRQYNQDNSSEIREHHKQYYQDHKDRVRARNDTYWQSTPERFLSDLWNRTKKVAARRINGKERDLDFSITRDDLYALWKIQLGKCAITGLELLHQWRDLRSTSIDRIDSSIGYTLTNIQLVCKGVNMLKNTHTQVETLTYFDLYYNCRKQAEATQLQRDIDKCTPEQLELGGQNRPNY